MSSPAIDFRPLLAEYERDGVVLIRGFLSSQTVEEVRAEIERYIRDDLVSKPADAATREADGITVRNWWRLEQNNPKLRTLAEQPAVRAIADLLVHGDAVLVGVETFSKLGLAITAHGDARVYALSLSE